MKTIPEQMCLPDFNLPRVVIIGGGFAGITLVRKLKKKPFHVVLIDRNNFHQFQPLLYQVATSALEPDSILFPYRKMFTGYPHFSFRLAEVQEIETRTQHVLTDRGAMHYDYLVIATGSKTNYFGMDNVEAAATGMKDVKEALNIRHMILQNLEKATISCDVEEREAFTRFIIVGGGPAGVEMAGALAEFRNYILEKDYPELKKEQMKVYLVEAGKQLLNGMSPKSSAKALKYLQQLGVEVLFDTAVKNYDGHTATTANGTELKGATLVWTAGVQGAYPEGAEDANIARANRLETNEFLQVNGYDNVFAAGDVASAATSEAPQGHPMVAQPAIQQGRLIAKNLERLRKKQPLKRFVYNDKGSMATIGKKKAVADIGRLHFGGYLAWLIWSVVHLMSISGFRNKLLVGLDWVWSYFSYEKSNRLIIRKYERKEEENNK